MVMQKFQVLRLKAFYLKFNSFYGVKVESSKSYSVLFMVILLRFIRAVKGIVKSLDLRQRVVKNDS